jgi:uncharacterized alkaline shock family protein YloU
LTGGAPDTRERAYGERLACGTPVADLLAQVADDAPPADPDHQRACAHCQAQLAQIATVWRTVQTLAAEPVIVPASFGAGVRRRILQAPAAGSGGTATPRPRAWIPLASDGHGTTQVGDTVLGRLAALAAASVPGVALAQGRSGAHVSAADGLVVVDLRVRLPYGGDVIAAADAVRMAVAVQLFAVAGLERARVDITIAGLEG